MNDPEGYMAKLDERVEAGYSDSVDESNESGILADENSLGTNPDGSDILIMTSEDQEKLKNELLNSERIVVDDNRYLAILNILHEYPSLFVGKEIEIVGFAYKEPDFEDDQFVIARFGVSCCVADASVYGIISTMDEIGSIQYEEDQWIRVTGKLSTTIMNDWELPLLQVTNEEKINEPENPYVYEYYIPLS
ncbi:TIGR03943 family putative permease subunit [Bacillus niameyensis]|uniref:TIGR03943 family putative permease subunit n=1 Tax=Bacillus niameyensis TaxID=1522308 RepID=UPI0007820E75|nr:TIGR03943 family protein [Bacillus niameyensis]